MPALHNKKYALIQDVYFWQQIKASSLEKIDWEQVITKCVELKNKIVNEDPYEDGKRKILNFGHTIGHAIESHYLSQGKDLLHGHDFYVQNGRATRV